MEKVGRQSTNESVVDAMEKRFQVLVGGRQRLSLIVFAFYQVYLDIAINYLNREQRVQV